VFDYIPFSKYPSLNSERFHAVAGSQFSFLNISLLILCRYSGVTVESGKEDMPSQNMTAFRLKLAIIPLDFLCSGLLTQ